MQLTIHGYRTVLLFYVQNKLQLSIGQRDKVFSV